MAFDCHFAIEVGIAGAIHSPIPPGSFPVRGTGESTLDLRYNVTHESIWSLLPPNSLLTLPPACGGVRRPVVSKRTQVAFDEGLLALLDS
jgi:hypothetical protein